MTEMGSTLSNFEDDVNTCRKKGQRFTMSYKKNGYTTYTVSKECTCVGRQHCTH